MEENIKMEESILDSIKELIGIGRNCTAFDGDIIIHINTVFLILNQLGTGPDSAFRITDRSAVWGSFMNGKTDLEMCKTYMALKVKMMFDPPGGAAVIEAFNATIRECEWRLTAQVETNRTPAQIAAGGA